MKCKHIQQQLLDYSEELLKRKDRDLLEDHLQACAACRQELHEINTTIHLLQSVPLQERPEAFWSEFTATVMRKIYRMDTVPATKYSFFFPSMKMAVVAAALLITIGSLFWYYSKTFQQGLPPHTSNEFAASGTPSTETIIREFPQELVSEELMNDLLEAEFALINGESRGVFDVDNSDEMLYFLISTLSEEEKDQLLSELYKMK